MEWYDFGLYAFMAAYLAPNFFATRGPVAGVLDVLLVFGIAFVFRPLGAVLLGPMGDRKGRLFTLVITFMGMAIATFAVGMLPTYDTIGIAAPILLVVARIMQGISAGGESGLAITYLAERSPEQRRGFFTSFIQASSISGFLLATLVTWLVTSSVGVDAMRDWGWRVPFLLALPLGAVGLYARWRLEESQEFIALQDGGQVVDKPIRDAFTSNRLVIVAIAAIAAFQYVGYYTVFSYFSGFMERLGHSANAVSASTTIVLCTAVVAVPLFGLLSDRIGRPKVLLAASSLALVATVPLFALMGSLSFTGVVLCQVFLAMTVAAYNASTAATYAEMSETRTRASSVTIGFNLGALLFAAPTLYLMTWLETSFGKIWASGVYMAAAAAISLVAVVLMLRSPLGNGVRRGTSR
jgi:MHS family proline/betaine transporter-like MFS transporter